MEEKNIKNVNTFRLMGAFDKHPIPWPLNELQMETRMHFLDAIESGKIVLNHRDKCLCGSIKSTQLSNIDRFSLPTGAYLCESCGLIYTSPYIAEESSKTYYEEFYHHLHFGKTANGKALYVKEQ